MGRLFFENNEDISSDIFFHLWEKKLCFYLTIVFSSPNSPSYGFSLWLPELRIILCALNITCGFLLYCVENNNSQDHFLSFLVQFWAWLQDRQLDTKVSSYCLKSFLSNLACLLASPTVIFFPTEEIFFPAFVYCAPPGMHWVLNIICFSAQCSACAVALARKVGWGPKQRDDGAPG